MIEVGAGEDDIGCLDSSQRKPLPLDPPAGVRPPAPRIGVPPPTISEMGDTALVRPCAALAPASGATEANPVRYLRPVDRIEPAVLGADRHGHLCALCCENKSGNPRSQYVLGGRIMRACPRAPFPCPVPCRSLKLPLRCPCRS